jgi:hypothetical protein
MDTATRRQHADDIIESVLGDLRGETYEVDIPTADEFQTAARWFLYVVEGPSADSQEPGSFTTQLIRTMMRADQKNLRLLTRVYPALTSMVLVYKTNPDGQRIVHGMAHLFD